MVCRTHVGTDPGHSSKRGKIVGGYLAPSVTFVQADGILWWIGGR
jgi:hypothetical protein